MDELTILERGLIEVQTQIKENQELESGIHKTIRNCSQEILWLDEEIELAGGCPPFPDRVKFGFLPEFTFNRSSMYVSKR